MEPMNTSFTTWVDKIVAEIKDQVERMIVHSMFKHKSPIWDGGVKEGLIDISGKTLGIEYSKYINLFMLKQLMPI